MACKVYKEPDNHSSTIKSLPHTSRGARTDTIHVHKYTTQQQKRYLSPVKNELEKKVDFPLLQQTREKNLLCLLNKRIP